MKLWHAPTGRLIKGHVLDVNERAFNEALRDYDKQLYTVWNPRKIRGWGCWEIRRRPNRKVAVYKGTHEGVAFSNLEYVEFNSVHHVLDAAFLNYDAIRKLKEMDTWNSKDWVSDLEDKEEERRVKLEQEARDELKYAIKQHRSAARDFYEAVRSGQDPARILTSIKWVSE